LVELHGKLFDWDIDKNLSNCHCYRGKGNTIRIISARKPNQVEKEIYGGYIL